MRRKLRLIPAGLNVFSAEDEMENQAKHCCQGLAANLPLCLVFFSPLSS